MSVARPVKSIALLATVAVAWGCADAPPSAPPALVRTEAGTNALVGASENHIVLTSSGTTAAALASTIAALGGTIVTSHDAIGVLSVSGLTDAAAMELDAHGGVLNVERDIHVQWVPDLTSLDLVAAEGSPAVETNQSGAFFFTSHQWNMRQIDANDAWLTTDQGEGALACILDTGIDYGHNDLIGKVDLAKSRSFVPSEPFIEDLNSHGTFVGALVSTRGLGMASVAPDARLCAVKVLSRTGSGDFSWVIAGIMHATDVRADVMNMSLGAYFFSKSPSAVVLIEALQRAVDYASNRGTLVVASSGNNGLDLDNDTPDFIHVPSQLQKVISVGATGPFQQQNFDNLAAYSNRGTTGVDMTAPGGNRPPGSLLTDGILSACSRFTRFGNPANPVFPCAPGNFYLIGGTGTSFAAPHVTGAAAVFATNTRATGGDNTDLVKRFDARFLEGCLEKGLDRIDVPNMDKLHGKGRLNVEKSMLCGSSPK